MLGCMYVHCSQYLEEINGFVAFPQVSGLSWMSLLTGSWHLNDRKFKNIASFPQQTTRDSKRRASKEAGALSKDGSPTLSTAMEKLNLRVPVMKDDDET